jgi:ubiquinone/menaquinone biosynthesis C-methylase UbiE
MAALIKTRLEKIINDDCPLILEIGCGNKKKKGRIGIDKVDLPNVDIVADIEQGLKFLPDNSVDEIHARSVLEHIQNIEYIMAEFDRVLKNQGKAFVFVPHFSNPYFYSDFTHKRPFGLYSFYYFVKSENQLKRKVPDYYTNTRINILSQRLVFRSSFKLLNPLRKLFGKLVNLNRFTQAYYEENLCYLFPCHGIEIVFSPDKDL